MKKIKAKKGESIAETLVAVLIMALAFLILVGAVMTAGRINARIKNGEVQFSTAGETETLSDVTLGAKTISVKHHPKSEESNYEYYKYVGEADGGST